MAEQSPGSQARRSFLGLGMTAALALALGGCQLVPKARPERVPEPVQPEAEAVPEEEPGPACRRRRPATGSPCWCRPPAPMPESASRSPTPPTSPCSTPAASASGSPSTTPPAAAPRPPPTRRSPTATACSSARCSPRTSAPSRRSRARAGVPVISFSNDASVAGNGVYLMGFTPGQSIARVVGLRPRARGSSGSAALTPTGRLRPPRLAGDDRQRRAERRPAGRDAGLRRRPGGPAGPRSAGSTPRAATTRC